MALYILGGVAASAADVTQGYVFGNTEHVTASKMNAIAGNAVINPAFITGKSAVAPVTGDQFILARSGTLYRCTIDTLLLGNTNIIVSQVEDTAIATNDFILTLDVSQNLLKKVLVNTLLTSVSNAAALNVVTNAATFTNYFYRSFTSTNCDLAVSLSNIPHLLGGRPQSVRWVLVCTTADHGYAVGDEVSVESLDYSSGVAVAAGANETNVFISIRNAQPSLVDKVGGENVHAITTASWRARCYARYFLY